MKKIWKKSSIFLTAFITAPLLTACFADYKIDNSQYQRGLPEIDMNNPGNDSNINVNIDNLTLERDYVRQHALSLKLVNYENDGKTVQKYSQGTGFVLSVYNDKPDEPLNFSDANSSTTFLVGTNLHVIKNFFPNLDLSKVNEKTQTNNALLSGENSNNNAKFYFADFDYDATSDNNKTTFDKRNYLIYDADQKKQKEFANPTNNNPIPDNTYLELPKSDVRVVYTATNLSLNKKIFSIDNQITGFDKVRDEINQDAKDLSKVDWIHSYNPSIRENSFNNPEQSEYNYSFAADFGVLELKIPNTLLSKYMRELVSNINTNESYVASKNNGFFLTESKTTQPFVIGGIHGLQTKQKELEELRIQKPVFIAKPEAKTVLPSTINNDNFFDHVEVKNLSEKFTIGDVKFLTKSDQYGTLNFTYSIISKDIPDLKYEVTDSVTVYNFQATGIASTPPSNYGKFTPIDDSYSAAAKWVEVQVQHGLFFDYSIYNKGLDLWNNKIANNQVVESDDSKKYNNAFLNYNNTNFLAIDQLINVPNLNLNAGASGSLVVSSRWVQNKQISTGNQLIGIYKGVSEFNNNVTKMKKYTGEINLLYNPLRYDLLGGKNPLSKPSLCDVLSDRDDLKNLKNANNICPVYEK